MQRQYFALSLLVNLFAVHFPVLVFIILQYFPYFIILQAIFLQIECSVFFHVFDVLFSTVSFSFSCPVPGVCYSVECWIFLFSGFCFLFLFLFVWFFYLCFWWQYWYFLSCYSFRFSYFYFFCLFWLFSYCFLYEFLWYFQFYFLLCFLLLSLFISLSCFYFYFEFIYYFVY